MSSYKPVPVPRIHGRNWFTKEEYSQLLEVARAAGLYEETLLTLMYATALRASEPGALRLDHLKLLHQGKLYIPRGKGSRSTWVEVSPRLARLLSHWINAVYPNASARRPDQYLFPGNRNRGRQKGITRWAVRALVCRLAERANLDQLLVTAHAIRKSRAQHFYSEAIAAGLSETEMIKSAAKLMGHASAQTTYRWYIDEFGEGKKIAEKVLDEVTDGCYYVHEPQTKGE